MNTLTKHTPTGAIVEIVIRGIYVDIVYIHIMSWFVTAKLFENALA